MYSFPENISFKLGFDQILSEVASKCKTEFARSRLKKIKYSTRHEEVVKWIDQTAELKGILESGDQLPSRDFRDLQPLLDQIKLEGSFLNAEEFQELKLVLTNLYEWTQFLKRRQQTYPELSKLTLGFISDKELVDEISRIINENGKVRDNASPALKEIRSSLINKEKAVRVVIGKVLKKAVADGFTAEGSEITIREGRLVIPLKAEHKRRIDGFVHDESSSGQTVFMEPAESLQLNNEVKELIYQEKREIAKILTRLSDRIRASLDDLRQGAFFLGLFDFIHAKARFSQSIEGEKPKILKFPIIRLFQARHPLLYLSHQRSGKPVVPLNIELTRQESRILVISGPNAGGKSVALKTTGLLQLMLQMGFLVPVSEASEMGIFKNIFLDIGDAQSLENDLSTYSSHLNAMKYFMGHADEHTLFLIDEFGSGTEPQFGGAIAESILSELVKRKSFGVITTHYHNLKEFADQHDGVINGAMKYDVAQLSPLFELEMGKRGSSFAFEIAKKIGLPGMIIKNAKSMVGGTQVEYERLLNGLEQERRSFEKKTKELKTEQEEIAGIRKDYESLKKMLESEKNRLIKQAREQAKQILDESNKKVEQTIREIKEAKADKEKTRLLRVSLGQFRKGLDKAQTAEKIKKEDLKVGDFVRMKDQEMVGEVINLKSKKAQVRFGNIISFIDLHKLSKTQRKNEPKAARRSSGISMMDRRADFSDELNVIGLRSEDALMKVDQYIDEAILLGNEQVKITHGKGQGILREVIRNHLKKHPMVESTIDEALEMGGSGVTLVYFKG